MDSNTRDHTTEPIAEPFAGDLLRGADTIAEFLFGDKSERRRVYHLVGTSRLPVFKIGSMWCARRTSLLDWVTQQERRAAGQTARCDLRPELTASDASGSEKRK